jgi:predicted XRE-type DNA-binding protein
VGYALYAAQNGEMDPSAKPMKGFGSLLRRYVACDLHRALSRRGLRAACLSEEIHIGQSYAEEGLGVDSTASSGRRKRLQREERITMIKRKFSKKTKVAEGSGNVFADLGLPNAEQELMKARLTLQIYQIIQKRGLTQTEAGKILGIPQPQVSALARNRAGNFSVGRLIDFLTALGQDVKITVTPARKHQGQLSVVVA